MTIESKSQREEALKAARERLRFGPQLSKEQARAAKALNLTEEEYLAELILEEQS